MFIQKLVKRLPIALLGFMVLPTYGATLDCSTATNINVPVVECQALLDLYDAIEGSTRQNKNNRDTDTNVCTWYGISCTNILGQDRVTSIDLYNNANYYVYGPNGPRPLPDALGNLVELEYLNLSFGPGGLPLKGMHDITGVLPTAWKDLTKLKYLNLSRNKITGPIPAEWSGMTNLEYINLRDNQINGSLPSEWSTLSNVIYINVGDNQLNGILPVSWSNLTNLTGLILGNYYPGGDVNPRSYRNQFDGTLPDSWGNLNNLELLNIAGNLITGQLPAQRSGMINISHMNISNNQLDGTLPPSWTDLSGLKSLYLQNNNIYGNLPYFADMNWLLDVVNLDLSNNAFTGTLPTERGDMTSIVSINLSDNELEGTLPPEWSGMMTLLSLNLSNNNLEGTLPDSRGLWTQISTNDLRWNFLEGYVPASRTGRRSQTPWTNFSHNCIIVNMFEPPTVGDWPFANSMQQNGTQDGCSADLLLTQSTSSVQVNVGDELVYTINYENERYNPATNPVVVFNPGTGINIISTSDSYSMVNEEYHFDLSDIPAGGTGVIVITGQVSGNSDVESVSLISSDTPDPNLDNNQSITSITIIQESNQGGGNQGNQGGSNEGSSGGSRGSSAVDVCINGDNSGSYYDDVCGKQVINVPEQEVSKDNDKEVETDLVQNGSCSNHEYMLAYTFGFENRITTMENCVKADMDGILLRKDAAKFISNYAINVLGKTRDTNKVCKFEDMAAEILEMRTYAIVACQLGIMGLEADGKTPATKFNPNAPINKAMFATMLSRLLYGPTYDTNNGSKYREGHVNKLKDMGVVTSVDDLFVPIKRAFALIMLMRTGK